MIISNEAIYRGKSFYKNGKRYELEEISYIFDCPKCEYIRSYLTVEAAETALDVHYFHHHPSAYVPLVERDIKDKIDSMFNEFRMRGYSPVGLLQEPSE